MNYGTMYVHVHNYNNTHKTTTIHTRQLQYTQTTTTIHTRQLQQFTQDILKYKHELRYNVCARTVYGVHGEPSSVDAQRQ